MTAACAATLGESVRAHTEDWHMMQRVFVRHLDRERAMS
jgi:KDO2-lipid IV(A) lauroyltransferase